jgi:pyridoxine 5-phosphate synthase
MPAKLSVNLNAIALLRNRRDLPWPSVTGLGRIALEAGAHGLTVHPQARPAAHAFFRPAGNPCPDRRRISRMPNSISRAIRPATSWRWWRRPSPNRSRWCQTIPSSRPQTMAGTSSANRDMLIAIVARLKKTGARISLFCDPDASEEQLQAAMGTGTDRIELYTGPYGACHDDSEKAGNELERLRKTAEMATAIGLGVNAGHDLTVANLPALARAIPDLAEVSIGHGLTADALEYGMAGTVKRFRKSLEG